MSKFKVGDKVRCVDCLGTSFLNHGNEYTIARCGDEICHIDENGGIYPVSRFELVAKSPPTSHTDTTRIVTSETHSWRGIALTSGAGLVDVVAVQGDKSLGVTLTTEQAEKLGSDLLDRVRRMRGMKA